MNPDVNRYLQRILASLGEVKETTAKARKPRMPAFKNLMGPRFEYGGVRVRAATSGSFGLHIDKVERDGQEYRNISMQYGDVRKLIDSLTTTYRVEPKVVKALVDWLKWVGISADGTRDMERYKAAAIDAWRREEGLPASPDFQYPRYKDS